MRRGEKNVLRELAKGEWLYGLQLVRSSESLRWRDRVRRGVLYVWLMRLKEKGLVESKDFSKDGKPSRRKFKLTEKGRAAADAL